MNPAYSPAQMPASPDSNPYYNNYYSTAPQAGHQQMPAQAPVLSSPQQSPQQQSFQQAPQLPQQPIPQQSFSQQSPQQAQQQPQTSFPQQSYSHPSYASQPASLPVQQMQSGPLPTEQHRSQQQYSQMTPNFYAQAQQSGVPYGSPMTQQPQSNQYPQQSMDHLTQKMDSLVLNRGFQAVWQNEQVNLMQEKDVRSKLIQQKELEEKQKLEQDPHYHARDFTCDRSVMCCTLKKMPDTASLLQRSRLPLGVILQPFKDEEIPLMQDSPIVRCRSCRAYINPYVKMLDRTKWQCNLCHRVNEVPDEFVFDFKSHRQIDILTRPEMNYGTIEYVASVEYMVRPPQSATYLFVLDCSASAVQLGYIRNFAKIMLDCLDSLPGDARTMIGFLAFDSKLHFFNLTEKKPIHYIMPDIEDTFIPHMDAVLVNLNDSREQIEDFLQNILPTFPFDPDTKPQDAIPDVQSALGPALQAALKIISASGGRVSLFQASLPNAGLKTDGCVLTNREDPNQRTANTGSSSAALTPLLNPCTDFFKKLALECSENQVTVDLFSLSGSYSDLATVSSVSKYCGGSVLYYGNSTSNETLLMRFQEDLKHYLSRPIGFEAVMRLRASRGLAVHTFHGNFFVRSTDLIALPNVNPDSSYAVQMTISDDLKDYSYVAFQAALLYTASNGERRIRVHTISLPVVTIVSDVLAGADQEAIVALLAKMAVDRSTQSNMQDAREALINANVDVINVSRLIAQAGSYNQGLVTSGSLKLLPLYSLALLKQTAFRLGISTKIDERYYAMCQMKSLPLDELMLYIYPNLYAIHNGLENKVRLLPLQLSFANIERNGVYLLDTYDNIFIYICKSVHPQWLQDVFGITQWSQIPDEGEQTSQQQQLAYNNNRSSQHNGYHTQIQYPPAQMPLQQKTMIKQDSLSDHNKSLSATNNPTESVEHNGDVLSEEDSSEGSSYPNSPLKKARFIGLPLLNNPTSINLHRFIDLLLDKRAFQPSFHILREDSRLRYSFLQYMYDDRNESAFSYYEFLQHIQQHLEK